MTAIARGLQADGIPTLNGAKRWSQATISSILRNPTLIGKVKYDGEVYDGQHEAIIPLPLWEKAQARLAAEPAKGKGRPTNESFLLRGLLRCGECGELMYPRKRTYECVNYDCPMGAVSRKQIDREIWSYFEREDLRDKDGTAEALLKGRDAHLDEAHSHQERAEGEAAQAAEALDRIRRDYKAGKIDANDWRELRDELESEREAANAEAERWHSREGEIDAQLASVDDELLELFTRVRKGIAGEVKESEGVEAARALLLRVFEEIVFYKHDKEGSFTADVEKAPKVWDDDRPDELRPEWIYTKRFSLLFLLREGTFEIGPDGEVLSKGEPLYNPENKSNRGSGCR